MTDNTGTDGAIDSFTVEKVKSVLNYSVKEMGISMARTAYSPIFNEGGDFSPAIFDETPELISQGADVLEIGGMPAQIGAMPKTVDNCVEAYRNQLDPGDVIIHNDTFQGGTHLPEFTMVRPYFYENEIVGYLANMAHHTDVGGISPGGFPGSATDIFMEGFRMPPEKLYRGDEEVKETWEILMANVRSPTVTRGDLQAQYSSLLRGESCLDELIQRHGLSVVRESIIEIKDLAERWMRSEIQAIPDGTYEFEDQMDDDGVTDEGPFIIKCTITVEDDEITVDWTGTADQAKGPINCASGVTASAVYNAILNIVDESIPKNAGCFRPITIISPEGTVVNVTYPGAHFGGQTETHNRLFDIILGALHEVIPEKIAAATGSSCFNFTYGCDDPETDEFLTNYQWEGCGWGARSTKDGNSVINAPVGNSRIQPIEVLETRFPFRHERYLMAKDSGGPGRYRGGLGTERIMTVTAPEIEINGLADRGEKGAFGLQGGYEGGKGIYKVRLSGTDEFMTMPEAFDQVRSLTKFSNVVLKEGESVLIRSSGGGGWGSPKEREPDAVKRDVLDGKVSRSEAAETYRVAVTETGEIDYEATETLRENSSSDQSN